MIQWWESLTVLGQILACIAIPSTLVMLVQIIMMLTGMGHDASADADVDVSDGADVSDGPDFDGDGAPDGIYPGEGTPDDFDSDAHADSGFRLLSFRSIIAFFAMFGWTGLVMLRAGVGTVLSVTVAIAVGIVVMVLVALMFMWLYRLQTDGSISIKNALGVSGTVYLRIPASRNGAGKVNILIQGSYSEMLAVTDEEKAIEYGEEVVVIGISGQTTLIVKRK